MNRLKSLINNVKNYRDTIPSIIGRTVRDNEAIIIDMVVEDQLFERGVNGDNQTLGKYSPVTIQIKRQKGQPTNRVTLRDTGDFHESYSLDVSQDGGFLIKASDFKYGELLERYGNIDALTDQNLEEVTQLYILPELLREFRKI